MDLRNQPAASAALPTATSSTMRNVVAIALAALLVSVAAQVVVPLPLTPIPFTLQPLAVLVVGGVLGARRGAAALALYLAMGLVGLPVFAAGGSGIARLMGPTGGYLLAFPVAAAATGALAGAQPGLVRALFACAVGMVLIHIGGTAQLAALGGDAGAAYRLAFVPFLTGDLLKIGLAAAVMLLAGPALRAKL
ncbi:MAG: biotin transporter BioY [Gemmatimonadales bacterium]|jgi:biotin transport system substrate-specific component